MRVARDKTLEAAAAQWMFQFEAPSTVAMRRAHSYRALVPDPATTHRESRAKLTRVRKSPPQGVEYLEAVAGVPHGEKY